MNGPNIPFYDNITKLISMVIFIYVYQDRNSVYFWVLKVAHKNYLLQEITSKWISK